MKRGVLTVFVAVFIILFSAELTAQLPQTPYSFQAMVYPNGLGLGKTKIVNGMLLLECHKRLIMSAWRSFASDSTGNPMPSQYNPVNWKHRMYCYYVFDEMGFRHTLTLDYDLESDKIYVFVLDFFYSNFPNFDHQRFKTVMCIHPSRKVEIREEDKQIVIFWY